MYVPGIEGTWDSTFKATAFPAISISLLYLLGLEHTKLWFSMRNPFDL